MREREEEAGGAKRQPLLVVENCVAQFLGNRYPSWLGARCGPGTPPAKHQASEANNGRHVLGEEPLTCPNRAVVACTNPRPWPDRRWVESPALHERQIFPHSVIDSGDRDAGAGDLAITRAPPTTTGIPRQTGATPWKQISPNFSAKQTSPSAIKAPGHNRCTGNKVDVAPPRFHGGSPHAFAKTDQPSPDEHDSSIACCRNQPE